MVSLKYLMSITKDYWNDFGFVSLFVLSLIGILIFEKDKIKRYSFLWYSLITIVLIYNPLSLYFFQRFLEPSTFDQYYRRFYGLVPIMAVIAYGFTLVITRFNGIKKLVALLASCGIIAGLGHCIYAEDWFTRAENRNKVPQDVVTICDIFADYQGDTIRIMAPKDLAVYMRQMDSRFYMPYSRYINDEDKAAYELTNLKPKPELVVEYTKEKEIDFVVVSAIEEILDSYLNYGFKMYGRTANYAVLMPNDPNWILTEYEDESGDQGLAYIMENKNDGTLIVVDGGNAGNEKQMREAIKNKGGKVDAWILTHYHKDHIDTFNAIYSNPDGITIKDIYVTPLSPEVFYSLNLQEWDDVDTFETFMKITEGAGNIHYVNRDDKLKFSDDMEITFFNAFDDTVLSAEGHEDIPNNDSLVFKMATEQRSILICADAHSRYIAKYLVDPYGDALDSDILQCGHHGNNSMPEDTGFYEAVSPEVAIFDGPDWLMTSPEYTAGALAAYLKGLGTRIIWYKTAPNVFGF